MNHFKKTKNRIVYLGLLLLMVGLMMFTSSSSQPNSLVLAAETPSSDAIAVRVMPNFDSSSPLQWYYDQGFTGSPEALTVDGYEAVRDGRTVYVNVGNVSGNDLYTNIYLISYNQDAGQATKDILGQILKHWRFNLNLNDTETGRGDKSTCSQNGDLVCLIDEECVGQGYCNSFKAQITRDVKRLAQVGEIKDSLENYKNTNGHYPILSSGSYLASTSISTWPSWSNILGLPVDPINELSGCLEADGYDPTTCWDEDNQRFALIDELNSGIWSTDIHASIYKVADNGLSYDFYSFSESGLNIGDKLSKPGTCQPVCYNKECGDDGCGGSCGTCDGAGESCFQNKCYFGCATPPGCQTSLANAYTIPGYCASGQCYNCLTGLTWAEGECTGCGDNNIDAGEQCDNGADNGAVCTPTYGVSCTYCSDTCINKLVLANEGCGDGVKSGLEECDNGGSNGTACVPNYEEDCTYCSVGCTKIFVPIAQSCGDNITNGPEECDNGASNGVICTPTYGASCTYCTSNCRETIVPIAESCGDNIINGPEECDGDNLNSESCLTAYPGQFIGGTLICNAGCRFDNSQCIIPYILSGNIKEALTGNDISGVNISVQNQEGTVFGTGITDGSGNFTINDIQNNSDYKIVIDKAGYKTGGKDHYNLSGDQSIQLYMLPSDWAGVAAIILRWGATPVDLDSHLIFPSSHISYIDKNDNGAQLDLDDTSSYGPETITIMTPVVGVNYQYYVQDFSDCQNNTGTSGTTAGAKVQVWNKNAELVREYISSETDCRWEIFNMTVDNNGILTIL